MKSKRSAMLFKIFVLAVGALGASLGSAQAQSASGKFALTHETCWGGVVLPPGDYTFSLQSPSLPAQIVVRKADGEMAIVLPQVVSTERLAETSKLVLNRSASGESFVSALYLGDLGLSLHYASPKAQVPASETARLNPIADSQPGK
jgi:hypothetical protein